MRTASKILLGLLCAIPLIASAVTRYEVAHTRINGQDVIIFPVSPKMNHMPLSDKQAITNRLTRCANSAGLSGRAVIAWPASNGTVGAFGPKNTLSHFERVNMNWVNRHINKKLACD